jgi:hypothetical protein
MLQELIQKLQDTHGLTPEQSHDILSTVTGFIKEKFPMLSGAVDNMFAPKAAATASAPAATTPAAETQVDSMMDKISDVIPGETGEKVEAFAKNAAHNAEGLFDSVKDKLSGLFDGDKK